MAKVGLKYPVFAPMKEDGKTYDTGFVVAKAIKVTVSTENNAVELYADDGLAESDKSFKKGKVSANVDDLTLKVYADLLGHTYKEKKPAESGGTETPETVVCSGNDIAPFGLFGYYGKVVRNSKPSYQAKILKKMQFSEPNDETETKGENTNFQTPTIEGENYQLDDGTWKEQVEFATEAEAVAWLNEKAGITTAGV